MKLLDALKAAEPLPIKIEIEIGDITMTMVRESSSDRWFASCLPILDSSPLRYDWLQSLTEAVRLLNRNLIRVVGRTKRYLEKAKEYGIVEEQDRDRE